MSSLFMDLSFQNCRFTLRLLKSTNHALMAYNFRITKCMHARSDFGSKSRDSYELFYPWLDFFRICYFRARLPFYFIFFSSLCLFVIISPLEIFSCSSVIDWNRKKELCIVFQKLINIDPKKIKKKIAPKNMIEASALTSRQKKKRQLVKSKQFESLS